MPANTLPNDVDTLKRMLVLRDETIAKLVAEIARLKRWQYGRSSERMGELMDQLQLALGDLPEAADDLLPLAEAPADAPPPTQPPTSITVLRRRPRALPTHLPRETIVHAPTACGSLTVVASCARWARTSAGVCQGSWNMSHAAFNSF